MATLIDRIKADSLEARKARLPEKSAFLTTLLSESSMPGKNDGNRASSDAEVAAICAKFDKNLAEVLAVRPGDPAALAERSWLAGYMPAKLGEGALRALILEVAASLGIDPIAAKDMGAIMSGLKTRAAGQYDGQMASGLVKSMASRPPA